MSQELILEFLKKCKKPVSRSEIAEELKISSFSVSHTLKKLLDHNEIKCIEISRDQARAFFRDKLISRRMNLYYF